MCGEGVWGVRGRDAGGDVVGRGGCREGDVVGRGG